jgi:hypothetical protein
MLHSLQLSNKGRNHENVQKPTIKAELQQEGILYCTQFPFL